MQTVLETIVRGHQLLSILNSLLETLGSCVIAALFKCLNPGVIRNDPVHFFHAQSLEQRKLPVERRDRADAAGRQTIERPLQFGFEVGQLK